MTNYWKNLPWIVKYLLVAGVSGGIMGVAMKWGLLNPGCAWSVEVEVLTGYFAGCIVGVFFVRSKEP